MPLAIVVGANGFLGSGIVNELLRLEFEVFAVYNFRLEKINPLANLINIDQLFDFNLKPDYIFFAPGNYANTHKEMLNINNLLYQCSIKYYYSKIIYISSTNIYGTHNSIINENSTFNNPGLYALSKLSGEFIASGMSKFSIIRFTYIYGPAISNNSFIPQIINSAKTKGQIILSGNGERVQDYIYIEDAVSLCLKSAFFKDNSIFLGVSGFPVSNRQIAEEIAKMVECKILFSGDEKGQSYRFNPEYTFKTLDWEPKVTISEGVKNMLI
jgi:nucleoside-diphosphate-sugar epimerase